MKLHYYMDPDDGTVIRVKAPKLPTRNNATRRGSWVVQEYCRINKKWEMPCMPEVTFGTLSRLEYLASKQVERAVRADKARGF